VKSGFQVSSDTQTLGQTAIELVASGKVDLDSLVTHRFSLDQVEEALQAPKLPGAMKPVVLPNG